MEFRVDENVNLKKEYLATIQKMIEGGRKYFGEAGVGLENQLKDPRFRKYKVNRNSLQVGIAGEKETSRVLRKWIADKPVILVDSVHLPLGDEEDFDEETGEVNVLGDTDHVLVVGNSLILIDSKNWKQKSTYSINEKGCILRGKKVFSGSYPKVHQNKYLWKSYLDGKRVDDYVSFVCISNTESNIIRDNHWWGVGYKLVNQETLVYFLDKLYEEEYKEVNYIRLDLVGEVLKGIQRPYNEVKEKFPELWERTRKR